MASVASQLIEEVTAHARRDSLGDAREICADGAYFPNNLCIKFYILTYEVQRDIKLQSSPLEFIRLQDEFTHFLWPQRFPAAVYMPFLSSPTLHQHLWLRSVNSRSGKKKGEHYLPAFKSHLLVQTAHTEVPRNSNDGRHI